MRGQWKVATAASLVALAAQGVAVGDSGATTSTHGVKSTTITLENPTAFTPVIPSNGTDVYHCTVLDPKNTKNEMITKVNFIPGNLTEDHHAVLYWVPPSEHAAAEKLNDKGAGWTCFGGTDIGGPNVLQAGADWLAGWAPGHGLTVEPNGTGMPLPKGSLIVMQIHYNLLAGAFPDRSKVKLTTVPESTSDLVPLAIHLYPAPIDLPCPSGQSGSLCDRSASLADIGQRFGQSAVEFDNLLEEVCHGGTPVPGDDAYCTWGVTQAGYIWDITPHMHLLGQSMTVTLNPNGSDPKVLLNQPYNFHYQRSWSMDQPVYVQPGDQIEVSCDFNPTLRSQLPYLEDLPPRYVLWADGSSDEMCLGIFGETDVLPTGVTASTVTPQPEAPQWPAALVRAAAKAKAGFLPSGAYTVTALRRDASRQQDWLALPVCD